MAESTLQLLHNAEVHAPQALGCCDILVAGPHIAWIGRPGTLPGDLPADVIDLAGRNVVPGLVDPHVHVTGGGGESGPGGRIDPLPAASCLRAGITTVIGVLGTDDVTRGPEDLLATVQKYRAQGVGTWTWIGGYHLPPRTLLGSPERDLVFVDPVIGIGEVAVSDHRSSQPTSDQLRRVAAQSRLGGLLSGKAGLVHVHLGGGERGIDPLREALAGSELPSNIFYPTHVNRSRSLLDDAAQFLTSGASVDVTAYPESARASRDGVPAFDALRHLTNGTTTEAERRVTVSSDAGGSLPVFDPSGHLLDYGVGQPSALTGAFQSAWRSNTWSHETVVRFFSTNAADLLKLPGRGYLHAGSCADLLVLGKDAEVEGVMASGTWRLPLATDRR